MSYSRIDKLVQELRGTRSLGEASDARYTTLNIVLGFDRTGRVAVMAQTALALALRALRGPINVFMPDGEPFDTNTRPVSEILKGEATSSEAQDRLQFESGFPISGVTLGLGYQVTDGFYADAAGWVAGINRVFASGVPAVAPASVFAVCATFGQLFGETVLSRSVADRHGWSFSLLDFTTEPEAPTGFTLPSLDLGAITLLGAGAIGSGFGFTLALSGWEANVIIVDRDRYDEPNWETTVTLTRAIERQRLHKARALSEVIAGRSRLRPVSVVTEVCNSSPILAERRDVLVCAVDNPETRRALNQAHVSLVLNGAVGGSTRDAGHVLCSRHGREDALLSTLYPVRAQAAIATGTAPIPTELTDECSRLAYQGVSMAAPFLGTASGALLLASCAQRVFLGGPVANYVKVDLLGKQQHRMQLTYLGR